MTPAASERPDLRIAQLFNSCFAATEQTRCSGGADEPLYRPARAGRCAQLQYRGDHAASALHEISHWCLAGRGRRQLLDFGYNYVATPRSLVAQVRFLRSEIRPQALERLFARQAGILFRCSFDDVEDRFLALRPGFEAAVKITSEQFERHGVAPRAQQFLAALRSGVS